MDVDESDEYKSFTFHYVSIKSCLVLTRLQAFFKFTFHYVSIKSPEAGEGCDSFGIYIPLCIY